MTGDPQAGGSRIVCVSVTAAGAALAARLPFEHRSGRLMDEVARAWDRAEGLVLICATGIAVRAVGPRLGSKDTDPAVVCVDDGGRWAVALLGGHAGGANRLARQVAGHLGAEAVVTTASDAAGLPALDGLAGLTARGDVPGVMRQWLDGERPVVAVDPELGEWPWPPGLAGLGVADGPQAGGPVIRLSDRVRVDRRGEVVLVPASLVLGVGASTGADPARLRDLVHATLADAGLDAGAVGALATLEGKEKEPAVQDLATALGVSVRVFPSAALGRVAVPNPSPVVERAVDTPSVAEAAALLGAGAGASLVVPKHKSADSTVAVARRAGPVGRLYLVGLGPGDPRHRTPAASAAVANAEVLIGYSAYLDAVADLTAPAQRILSYPIGAERERCAEALDQAAAGRVVALVCSGDPGVYAMASLVLELAPAHGDPPVEIVPGVTAALTAAAVLGAPLGHDHAAISLSDLLTPWEVIEARLQAVAEADLVVSLYNPRSARRTHQLVRALEILGRHRPADTPAAVVTDAGRPGQRVVRATVSTLDPAEVDMVSLVVVGSSSTRWISDRMVTPRGYGQPDGP